jgi:hypothetical protein
MIGAIPNPKKSFQVEKPITEVNLAIEHLPLFTKKYKIFKSNKALNLFTFEATELLSLGVYIDINCSSLNEFKTDLTIEIRRKVGSFNQPHEVTLANSHISNITELISQSVGTDSAIRVEKFEKIEALKKQNEEILKQKAEESRLKDEEEKKNNPVLYYGKQVVLIALSIGMIGGLIFLIYKVFIA